MFSSPVFALHWRILKQFFLHFAGDFQGVRVGVVPVDQHAEEDYYEGQLDEQEGVGLRFVVVRLGRDSST